MVTTAQVQVILNIMYLIISVHCCIIGDYDVAGSSLKNNHQVPQFTDDEHVKFQRLYEEGCDATESGDRYNKWIKLYHPKSIGSVEYSIPTVQLLQHQTAFKRFMHDKQSLIKLPSIPSQSCGRVLTAAANLKRIEEKEQNEKKNKEALKKLRQGISYSHSCALI